MIRPIAALALAVFLSLSALAADPAPALLMDFDDIAIPPNTAALPGSAAVTAGANGMVWLSWVEPMQKTAVAIRCASFDAEAKAWRAPITIVNLDNYTTAWADAPVLSAGATGKLAAAWTVRDARDAEIRRVYFSTTSDSGATWTAPALLTKESTHVELASLTTLVDGRVLAAWLDGRGGKKGDRGARLFTRFIDAAHVNDPDVLLDPLVSENCPIAAVSFLDGGALLAYRGRTDDEIRDVHTVRRRDDKWAEDHALNHDVWTTNHDPVNGPRLAADGGRVAATWFTAADNEPRVLISQSPDAGSRFLMPLHVDNGQPIGRPDLVQLHDSAIIGVWLENVSAQKKAGPGGVWVRRITPDFTMDKPQLLAPATDGRVIGYPRAALVRDYAGGKTDAQFIVSFTVEATGLRTVLVTVPEGQLLSAHGENNCHCAPTPEQLVGYPVGGSVAEKSDGKLTLKHTELPGLFAAGSHTFRAAPEVLAAAGVGNRILARIERREGEWWIFDVRVISERPRQQ